jgi:hypothetical protein
MLRYGKIVSIDTSNKSGLLVEVGSKKEFFFTQYECKNEKLPKAGELVSFEKDTDFKHYNIAIRVHTESI